MLDRAESLARRTALLSQLDPPIQFNRLFDYLNGVHFFAKNRDGEILCASVGLARLYGFTTEDEFIGRTDFDVLPIGLAKKFRRDDLTVMETGTPLLGIVELFLNPQGIPDWYLTNKIPLWSRDGRVVGLTGSIQEHREATDRALPGFGIDAAVAHLRADPADSIPTRGLAAMCGMSVRQFEVKFRSVYFLPPNQFRIRLRVMRACELLRDTKMSVARIAVETGFYDQSALAHHFKAVMGYGPLQYRKQFDRV